MHKYRFYFSTGTTLTGDCARYECVDDADAIVKAGELGAAAPSAAKSIEIWELGRLVAKVAIIP